MVGNPLFLSSGIQVISSLSISSGQSQTPPSPDRKNLVFKSGFTLVELMAVIGIIGLLAVVGVPAIKGLTGSGGKKQALAQILGALEVARNTAISTGTNTAVIFPDSNFPSSAYQYRSMAVVTWDRTNGANANTMAGPWITLPQGIVFHARQIGQLPRITNAGGTVLLVPPAVLPITNFQVRGVVFGYDGSLEEGSHFTNSISSDGIAFYEGAVLGSGQTTNNSGQTNVETIKITRFTGRPQPTLAAPK